MDATRLVTKAHDDVCMVCGAPLEPDAMFCIVCGTPIDQAAAPAVPPAAGAVATCPQCGAPLEPDAAFCVVCGARTNAGGAAQSQGGFGAGAGTSSCPVCGWDLEPGSMYCIGCGNLVAPAGRSDGGKIPQPSSQGTARIENESQDGNFIPFKRNVGQASIRQAAPQPQPRPAPAQAPVQVPEVIPGVPITPVPAPVNNDDDDDATVRPRLIMLSREEARTGCRKTIRVDRNKSIEVNVPAGVDVNTKLDVVGFGHFDEITGQRGPLRLSFYID